MNVLKPTSRHLSVTIEPYFLPPVGLTVLKSPTTSPPRTGSWLLRGQLSWPSRSPTPTPGSGARRTNKLFVLNKCFKMEPVHLSLFYSSVWNSWNETSLPTVVVLTVQVWPVKWCSILLNIAHVGPLPGRQVVLTHSKVILMFFTGKKEKVFVNVVFISQKVVFEWVNDETLQRN